MGELGIHFGRDLEETWPEITIGKTSVMILEAFFDRILEEIGRDRNSFWKRLGELGIHFGRDLARNHYWKDSCHDIEMV